MRTRAAKSEVQPSQDAGTNDKNIVIPITIGKTFVRLRIIP